AAGSSLLGGEQRVALERSERELDNLRAAMGWAERAGDADLGLGIAAPIWRFWDRRGRVTEGLAWLERGLAGGAGASPSTRARALEATGSLTWRAGDDETAASQCEAALTLYRELDDRRGVA